jgi:hypothetical protein
MGCILLRGVHVNECKQYNIIQLLHIQRIRWHRLRSSTLVTVSVLTWGWPIEAETCCEKNIISKYKVASTGKTYIVYIHLHICTYIHVYTFGPPLWSSDQSSWLQIERSGFDSRHYQIFWEVMGLEWGPLSFVSTIEELLCRKSSGSSLENRDYGRRDP